MLADDDNADDIYPDADYDATLFEFRDSRWFMYQNYVLGLKKVHLKKLIA